MIVHAILSSYVDIEVVINNVSSVPLMPIPMMMITTTTQWGKSCLPSSSSIATIATTVAVAIVIATADVIPSRVFAVALLVLLEHPPQQLCLRQQHHQQGPRHGNDGCCHTDRDNEDHDTDSDCRCRGHCPKRTAMAVAMMMIAGKRGGHAMARRLQGKDEATAR